jgi:oligogalacturonide transporter
LRWCSARRDPLALAAIVFSKQMKLDRQAHLVVLQEVARIKAGGKVSDIPADVRSIVEDLVGHRYEECWGNSKRFKDEQPAPADRYLALTSGFRPAIANDSGAKQLSALHLRRKLKLNQRNRFLDRAQRHRIGRSRMAGKIDGFQLRGHFFAHFNRGDDINDVENLFDNQLAGDNVRNQFVLFGKMLRHLLLLFRGA